MAKFRVPHTLVLLMGMIILALLLTYILPQGSFQRETNEGGREVVVPGTYERVAEPTYLSPVVVFTAIPEGFEEAAYIIFFVFLIGGAIGVVRATGSIDALLGALIPRLGKTPSLFIGGGLLIFAAGSSTIGMAEEYLPFVPILLALAIGLGFDAVTAIGVLCVGYGVGYGAAIINPFTLFIAQGVAELQPGSGMGYRLVLLVIFLAIGFQHVWSYAKKVKDDPSKSLVADVEPDHNLTSQDHPELTGARQLILVLCAATIGVLIYGLIKLHWYVHEMGALFLGAAVVVALIGGIGLDKAAQKFCEGAAELTTTALLIGFARTIELVLDKGGVIDTIVHGIALPLTEVGPALAAVGMMVVQSICNFFIPSGSGQAYVTMPLMAPLADLVGVHRQVAVLAYQFGDGLTNILVPTNAVLIGILTMARIPYDRWLRFIFPFMVKMWIAGGIALATAVMIGYS